LPLTARHADKLTIVRSMRSGDWNHERATRMLELLPAPRPARMGTATRLVESGERFVVVETHGWDTHADNFGALRDRVLPAFDRGFSSLLDDLDARGLLATTLVVVTGEFGRSPRINSAGGRDHHAAAWSAVLAGGGLPGGRVVGATDRTGTEVVEVPIEPADLLRTVAAVLGVERRAGRVIGEVLA
jgi:uncharacterized protein (DUF1501 family)